MSAADFKKLVDASELLESEKPNAKGFVTVKAGGSSQSAFRLTPERV